MNTITLRPYQEKGVAFLEEHMRGALHDSPGLGKTPQATEAAINHLPAIVVAPAYLKYQWQEHCLEQYPGTTVALADGSAYKRVKQLERKADWYIVNVEMLRTFALPVHAQTLILDEAHRLSNRHAKQSIHAQKYAQLYPRVYELTATPIRREADGLWQQLRILDPKRFTSYHAFVQTYCITRNTQFGMKVVGISRPKALAALVAEYALGRSYKDVGQEMPRLTHSVVRIDMTKDTATRYRELKDTYRLGDKTFTSAGAMLNTLRRMTMTDEKIAAIRSLVDDTNGEAGTVVFTWYKDSAHTLARALKCPVITGEMTNYHERTRIAKGSSLIVCNIAALTEGVDLSHLRNVIYAEEDYTPGNQEQTMHRVFRPSANTNLDPVRVYYVLHKNSVDETVHSCVMRRIGDAQQIMSIEMGDYEYAA